MTTPLELFRRAQAFGLRLEADAGDLLVKPRSKCPIEFIAELKQHKAELLTWLNSPPCPGWRAIPPLGLPLLPSLPHPAPADARRVVAYVSRQCGDDISHGSLVEWCLRREAEYWAKYGWPDAVCCYAAARDDVCWQLGRDEREVWDLLSGFEQAAKQGESTP